MSSSPCTCCTIPQSRERAYERAGWREGCRLLKERLEELYGVTITDDDLRAAARRRNRLRAAQISMFELQAAEPPVMGGVELMSTMIAGTFNFDVDDFTSKVEGTVAARRAAYDAGERPIPASAKRILITGCPVGGVINKIGRTIERNGGVVVCMDDCSGERTARMQAAVEGAGIPYMKIETDYSAGDQGQIDTRIAAFIETL